MLDALEGDRDSGANSVRVEHGAAAHLLSLQTGRSAGGWSVDHGRGDSSAAVQDDIAPGTAGQRVVGLDAEDLALVGDGEVGEGRPLDVMYVRSSPPGWCGTLSQMKDPAPIFGPAISGSFFRAIDRRFRERVLFGSREAGRYSRASEPTLYLSSSRDGVEAAMMAHTDARSPAREIMVIDVKASRIVDLRDAAALKAAGVELADAVAPLSTTSE